MMNKTLYICIVLFFSMIHGVLGQTNTAIRIRGFYSQLANPTFSFILSKNNGGTVPLIHSCWKPTTQGGTNPNNLELAEEIMFYGDIGAPATLTVKAWNTDVPALFDCVVPANAQTFTMSNIAGSPGGSYYTLSSNSNNFVLKIEAISTGGTTNFPAPLIYYYPFGNSRHCLGSHLQINMMFPSGYMYPSNALFEWEYFFPPDSTVNPQLAWCLEDCTSGIGIGVGDDEGGGGGGIAWCEQSCYNQHKPIAEWKKLNFFSNHPNPPNTTSWPGASFIPSWSNISATTPGYSFDKIRGVYFRARTKHGSNVSEWSNMLYTEFMPIAPKFSANSSDLVITPSCPNGANGIIQVNNVVKPQFKANTYINSYSYVLRAGANNFAPVDPLGGTTILAPLVSETTTSNNLTIDNLAPGDYTLLLLNPGGDVGTCYSYKTITVPFYPILDITDRVTLSHVSCYGGTNGSIQVTPIGGYGALPLQHDIEVLGANATFLGTKTVSGRNVTYSNLQAGVYKITVEDYCKQLKTTTLVVKQPPQTIAFINDTIQPSCNNMSNGVIIIKDNTPKETLDNYLQNRSDSVSYQLYKNGNPVPIQSNPNYALSIDRKLTLNALEPGTYALKLRNLATPNACNMGVNLTFTIFSKAPIPPVIATYSHVSCKNGNNGGFQIADANFTDYDYYVHDLLRNRYDTLAASIVDTLKVGSYRIVCKRKVVACLDSVFTSFAITEPPLLTVSSTSSKNITCFEAGNGNVVANAMGGVAPYNYHLQISSGNNTWTDIATNGVTTVGADTIIVTNGGYYRIKVVDVNLCQGFSNPINIYEPAPLNIDSLVFQRAKCMGEQNRIKIYPKGGTAPYVHQFSLNNGVYQIFNNNTVLVPGSYKIKVTDANGCPVEAEDTFQATSTPTTSLEAEVEVQNSMYDYQVSCRGGADGHITLRAHGGATDFYEYRINNQPFVRFELDTLTDTGIKAISGLASGVYNITIRDANGCEKYLNATLNEPYEDMSIILDVTQPTCPNSNDGALVAYINNGGYENLTMSIMDMDVPKGIVAETEQGSIYLAGNNLRPGNYIVFGYNKTGCSAMSPVITISPKYPNSINAVVDVIQTGCPDEPGKSIISLAIPQITFWNGVNVGLLDALTSDTITYLEGQFDYEYRFSVAPGSYYIFVNDGLSPCGFSKMIEVTNPAPIQVSVAHSDQCANGNSAFISFAVTGGTKPYYYSIDGGQSFTSDSLQYVSSGTYELSVQDSKGCQALGGTVAVEEQTEEPNLQFLVSSINHSRDSLSVKDISIPKADSIKWVFPQNASVIDTNQWNPTLLFYPTGIFNITMTGYYDGCAYTLSKNVEIKEYDPVSAGNLPIGTRMLGDLVVYPNPNNGNFTYKFSVAKKRKVIVTLVNVLGEVFYQKEWNDRLNIEQQVNLPATIPNGFYILRVVTDIDARQATMSITK